MSHTSKLNCGVYISSFMRISFSQRGCLTSLTCYKYEGKKDEFDCGRFSTYPCCISRGLVRVGKKRHCRDFPGCAVNNVTMAAGADDGGCGGGGHG